MITPQIRVDQVAEVLVIMLYKFQQSFPIDSEVPQFQFIDRMLDIFSFATETGAVLGRDSAENCGVSAVAVLVGVIQFLDNVVAVPVGATTVIMVQTVQEM